MSCPHVMSAMLALFILGMGLWTLLAVFSSLASVLLLVFLTFIVTMFFVANAYNNTRAF